MAQAAAQRLALLGLGACCLLAAANAPVPLASPTRVPVSSSHAAAAMVARAAKPHPAVAVLEADAADELSESYQHLDNEFYKKIDARILMDGARNGLDILLKYRGISKPQLPGFADTGDEGSNIKVLVNNLKTIVTTYAGRVRPKELMYAEIAGMAAAVKDKYTLFLSPHEFALLNEGLDGGNFSGVGLSINIDQKTKYLHVDEVIPGGPASKAAVEDDDIITEIDGKSTLGLSAEDDSKRLRGKVGTTVHLTILRGSRPLTHPIAIVRAIIHQPSVVAKMLPGAIGYAHVTVFGSTTGRELSDALDHLDQQGAKAWILDLRDNGGGYLTSAIDVASKFVPSGPIVSVEERGSNNTQYEAEDTALRLRPLAVLVNRFTASASEITSGAIQDNGVGTLIGTRTYGKGVVQTIFTLPDGSALKVTTARYFTPSGRDINSVGIQPDIKSDLAHKAQFGNPSTDSQLQTAMNFLNKSIMH